MRSIISQFVSTVKKEESIETLYKHGRSRVDLTYLTLYKLS